MRAGGARDSAAALRKRIRERTARVAVVGAGYVGLSLAMELVRGGFRVIAVDVDEQKVRSLRAGRSYVIDIPSADVAAAVRAGRLTATTDFGSLRRADAVSICVPTPLRKTKDPDISYILSAAERLAPQLHAGMLVVLESTTYPGTTREVILPLLTGAGLVPGVDIFLAFSPERVDPGNRRWNTRNTPKVVGGITPACTAMARELYAQVIETVVPVSCTESAEMVKLLENTFRSVNIGLVNEVAIICDKLRLDVWEIIGAAATKPFGFMPFYPGPGLGGHCIPIDPHYLAWKMKTLDYRARFIELASEVNAQMPEFVLAKAQDALNERRKALRGARVLVCGVAYKRDVDDVRESPALDLLRLFQGKGAQVSYADPKVASLRLDGRVLRARKLTPAALKACDVAVIVTDHSAFDYDAIGRHAPLVVDTRNAMKGVRRPRARVVRL
jgi:UDP-N-acetyl-D-glucosamine dehydrogenase